MLRLVWKLLDWQSSWVQKHLNEQWSHRLSSLMLDVSLLFFFYAPFSGEKQGVYQMSFLSLLFSAIIAEKQDEK